MSEPNDEQVLAFSRLFAIAYPRGVMLNGKTDAIVSVADIATILNRVTELEMILTSAKAKKVER